MLTFSYFSVLTKRAGNETVAQVVRTDPVTIWSFSILVSRIGIGILNYFVSFISVKVSKLLLCH